MFLMSLGFSIILTGVWPYLDKVSKISAFQMSALLKQSSQVEIDNIRRQLFFMDKEHFSTFTFTITLVLILCCPNISVQVKITFTMPEGIKVVEFVS